VIAPARRPPSIKLACLERVADTCPVMRAFEAGFFTITQQLVLALRPLRA